MQTYGATLVTGTASPLSSEPESSYYDNNVKRIHELDLLKTIAIVAMVSVHILEIPDALDTSSQLSLVVANVIKLFGCVPSAGVFMFAMDWGAARSHRSTAKTYLDRVLQLTILGLDVNFFQQLVPMLLCPAHFGVATDHLYTLLAVDIYQFASLAMFYFIAMQVLGKSTRGAKAFSVVLACGCMLANALVGTGTLATGNMWLGTVTGLIIGQNEYSYFPFVSWIVFPVAGYGTAFLYERFKDKRDLPRLAIVAGASAIAVSEVLILPGSCSNLFIGGGGRPLRPASPTRARAFPHCPQSHAHHATRAEDAPFIAYRLLPDAT